MNYCRIPHHDGQKIKYICVDRKCGNASKIGCADCFLEYHVPRNNSQHHKRVLIIQFQNELNQKQSNLNNLQIPSMTNDFNLEEVYQSCLNQVLNRLNNYKNKLQEEVKGEIDDLQNNVQNFNTIQQQLAPQKTQLDQLSQKDLDEVIKFHTDCNAQELQNKANSLNNQRNKIILKQEKTLQKLQRSVKILLKELDYDDNDNIHGTPEKKWFTSQTPQVLSGSSTTQSPPIKNLVEIARQKKGNKQK